MFALPVASYDTLPWLEPSRAQVTDELRREALAAFLPAFEERYRRRRQLVPPNLTVRIGAGDQMLQGLQQEGYALAALSDEARRQIRELTLPVLTPLHAALDAIARPKFEHGQVRLEPEAHAPLFAAVSAGLAECGAMDALAAYAGKPLVLHSLGLQVNTAKQTLARYGELDAAGRPERTTSYFHVDSNDWPGVKVLIYLSDVGPEQGPFRFVRRTHQLMEPFEAAVRKTNDKLRHTALTLCALPQEYAQHAYFGEYIDPASPASLKLLEDEVAVCDGRSDLILFDNNGVHRGGMVREGHRYLLQCMFLRPPKSA